MRLVGVVALAFLLQESAEHFVSHGHLPGLGALFGPEYPLALPVLVAACLVGALLASLVRERERTLLARIARVAATRRRPAASRAGAPRTERIAWASRCSAPGSRPSTSRAALTVRQRRLGSFASGRHSEAFVTWHYVGRCSVLGALVAAIAIAAPALAHEERTVGVYSMEVGLIDEPVFTGQKSGLEFSVFQDATPVEGLADTLKAQVTFEGTTRDLPISARSEEPGWYESRLLPHRGRSVHLPHLRHDQGHRHRRDVHLVARWLRRGAEPGRGPVPDPVPGRW